MYACHYTCSPLPQSDSKSIDRNAFIYTYEPIEHDTHTDNEVEGEEWSDNLAYGKVESEDEVTEHQLSQCEAVLELQGNESYNPVTSISAQEEKWTDNLAYGKVESQLQCEAVSELQGNESYNPVPSITEEWTDNLAYGKVESLDEVTEHQLQCEAIFELQGNESYNPVPLISAQDEGEYVYAAFSVESPAQMD